MQYTSDCMVVSPENLRDRLKQKIFALCHLYGID